MRRIHVSRPVVLAFAAAIAAAACEPRPVPVEEPAPPITGVDRDERIRRPLEREGMVDTLEFRLVRSPEDFWAPFSTYVPDGIAVEFAAVDETRIAHFIAEFGGVRNDRARLSVYTHPPGSTVDNAQAQLAAYLSGLFPDDTPVGRDERYERSVPVEPDPFYPWARDESRYMVDDPGGRGSITGRAGVGSHRDHVFHFIIEYPPEYGDGMGPVIQAIFDEWRWESDGTMLRDTDGNRVR